MAKGDYLTKPQFGTPRDEIERKVADWLEANVGMTGESVMRSLANLVRLQWDGMDVTARMDGSPLERAHWRISALRETLNEIATTDATLSPDAPGKIAKSGLSVDDWNAERGFAPGPTDPPVPPAPRVA